MRRGSSRFDSSTMHDMGATEIAWLGVGFTTLGALIGAFAALLAARLTWQHLHYNEAAATFRSAFVDTIYLLRSGKQDVFSIITLEALADQERALIRFEAFLKPSAQAKLRAAWAQYSAPRHTTAPGSLDKRPQDIARAEANIHVLLQSARPK